MPGYMYGIYQIILYAIHNICIEAATERDWITTISVTRIVVYSTSNLNTNHYFHYVLNSLTTSICNGFMKDDFLLIAQ